MNQVKTNLTGFCVPTQELGFCLNNNRFFIRRDDLYPVAFGGNKARKAEIFFEDILKNGCDTVVTYGSSSSNHCRAVACLASQHGIGCVIVSPSEQSKETSNNKLSAIFGAKTVMCGLNEVSKVIDDTIAQLSKSGRKPYFIYGGGHGNFGTLAYKKVFEEILECQKQNGMEFDYIFHASGTGTTQAGLVAGALESSSNVKIVGISIARKVPRGRDIVVESVKDFNNFFSDEQIQDQVEFVDDYVGEGYGKCCEEQILLMKSILNTEGLPLDHTYTGKAFYGMTEYIKKHNIENKNILFIHTGGTPLFYDDLERLV